FAEKSLRNNHPSQRSYIIAAFLALITGYDVITVGRFMFKIISSISQNENIFQASRRSVKMGDKVSDGSKILPAAAVFIIYFMNINNLCIVIIFCLMIIGQSLSLHHHFRTCEDEVIYILQRLEILVFHFSYKCWLISCICTKSDKFIIEVRIIG